MGETSGVAGLAPLEPMIGSWRGVNRIGNGTADVDRRAEYVLGGRFIRVSTRSQSADDVHEDIAFYGYDEQRDTIVVHEFHSEGHVIRYRLIDLFGRVFTFASEYIENAPDPSLRIRLVLTLGEELGERLESSIGDGPFEPMVDLQLERAATATRAPDASTRAPKSGST